jgi:cytochrome P450
MTETSAPAMPLYMHRDLFSPAPELGEVRANDPVTRIDLPLMPITQSAWMVTRYDDVRAVLGDTGRFSNVRPEPMGDASGMLLMQDPPEHSRLRRMLTSEFTVKRIRRLAPRIEAIVTDHLDALERAGSPADLVAQFALPIPSLVICELLGVPYADRDGFQQQSRLRLDMSRPMPERMAAVEQSRAYMTELVARKRVEPDDDMLGMLIREHGADLTDNELIGIADLLLLAGHETTSNMLGMGTLLLLQHPEQLAQIRDNDEIVDQAIEEMMRYLSIVHSGVFRFAAADTELRGKEIHKGDAVVLALASANRDAPLGENLETFDINRKQTSHVAFGHGVHHCLGAPLARMEMRMAFPALLRRFPGLRAEVSLEQAAFRAYSFIYGLESLPVSW